MILGGLWRRSVLSLGLTTTIFTSTPKVVLAASSHPNNSRNTSSFSAFVSPSSSYGPSTTISSTQRYLSSVNSNTKMPIEIDPQYPGTAVARLKSVHARIAELASKPDSFNGPWNKVRQNLLWAGGLKDLPNAVPGMGYTGHSFNDYNHVDLTTMNDETVYNTNDGTVKQIAVGNNLGPGIQIASIPDLGPGGSWSTCSNGCDVDPPNDVAHVQFRSRIAFKLVWVPNQNFDVFVLVDDDGNLLAKGKPTSEGPEKLPDLRQRQLNYRVVYGSKYAVAAEKVAFEEAGEL